MAFAFTYNDFAAASTVEASEIQRNFTEFESVLSNGVTSANFDAAAGITGDKLEKANYNIAVTVRQSFANSQLVSTTDKLYIFPLEKLTYQVESITVTTSTAAATTAASGTLRLLNPNVTLVSSITFPTAAGVTTESYPTETVEFTTSGITSPTILEFDRSASGSGYGALDQYAITVVLRGIV